jgi:EAL domain-containing protein (putative c-di-GMP-specific phosphodiesterase class I)
VAEGIEDQATLDAVASFGCDSAQGSFFSRPFPSTTFAERIGHGMIAVIPALPVS